MLVVLVATLGVLIGGGPTASGQSSLSAQRASADRLRSAVAAEERRIGATRETLAASEARLARLNARADQRKGQLVEAQDQLVRARIHLAKLQRKEARAQATLADNLRASYQAGRPTIATVVLTATDFSDLIDRVAFFKRVSKRNARIFDVTRDARRKTRTQAADLEKLRKQFSALAEVAISDRNQAQVLRSALLTRQARQLSRRDGVAGQLATVRSRISRIERAQAVAARQAAAAATAAREAPRARQARQATPAGGGGGGSSSGANPAPSAPSSGGGGNSGGGGGSDAVSKVVSAASEIATTPYVWGGGHGGASGGYDCSGSISYALAAAGLISGPMASGGFMSWGDAGPGRHITIYANAGHMFMIVDGRRFDTSNLSGGGTRWSSASRSTAGFTVRHPPGL